MKWEATAVYGIRLPGHDEPMASDIGGAEKCSMGCVDTNECRPCVHHEWAQELHVVPESLQRVGHVRGYAVLYLKNTGPEEVVSEALLVVKGVNARGLDGLLRAHPEDGDVEEHLKGLLVLAIAARTAECHERLAVAEDDRGGERRARSFARPKGIGLTVPQHKSLHAVPERHARIPGDEHTSREPGR